MSFDIVSLFTNVPLQDTLRIRMGHLGSSSIPENLFLEFIYLDTEGVEFSLNDIMYAQIDRVRWAVRWLQF